MLAKKQNCFDDFNSCAEWLIKEKYTNPSKIVAMGGSNGGLLMGVTMLWQARMTPPSPGMDPTQQKIMKYMPLMFLFMLYNFSAGLTLYWTVQNLLTIAQMKLTKAQQDPAAASKAPVIAAPPKKKK